MSSRGRDALLVIEDVQNQFQQAWLFRNDYHAYFTIEDSRSKEIPLRVMGDAAGVLVADDYAGYHELIKVNDLLHIQCWAHTRRKFFDIQSLYPEVSTFLDLVKVLYKKNAEFKASGAQTPVRRHKHQSD